MQGHDDKLNVLLPFQRGLAGHSGGVTPGPIPNPEVKPVVATVLVRSVRSCEAVVPAPILSNQKSFYQGVIAVMITIKR